MAVECELLTIDEVASRVKVHASTVRRWITVGVSGRGGRGMGPKADVVRLEAVRVGGEYRVSDDALARFTERCSGGMGGTGGMGVDERRSRVGRIGDDEAHAKCREVGL